MSRTLWRGAYELAALLVVAVLLLVPVHRAFVQHLDVVRTRADGLVELAPGEVREGEVLTLWRFHGQWKVPLGEVRVERVGPEGALARFDPSELAWPMGRHGRVIDQEGRTLTLDVGSELGFAPGDRLTLFDGRRAVGSVRLQTVSQGRSTAVGGPRGAVGLGASEYTVRTQATAGAEDPRATALGLALLALLGGGWAGALAVGRRWPLDLVGERLRRWRIPAGAARALEVVALGTGLGVLGPAVIGWLLDQAAARLGLPHPGVADLFREGWIATAAVGVAATGAASWGASEGPWRRLRRAARWERSWVARLPPQGRAWTLWLLHLVVAWAFARTLWGFLTGNLRAALSIAWPGAPRDAPGLLDGLVFALTHLPTFTSWAAAFEVAKFTLWSLTIAGCMWGYGHSVLAPLWRGSKIRSLDFTLPGWATTAICYPILGPALWQLVPGRIGLDPLVTGGLPEAVALVTGLWLNLLYTLSILSMGTRFGVLVDKGLVDHGFHAVVRHPSYTLEAAMFVVLDLSGLTTWREWLGASSSWFVYWLRSEREDDYMASSNPDYLDYRERVRWKFLPGVW